MKLPIALLVVVLAACGASGTDPVAAPPTTQPAAVTTTTIGWPGEPPPVVFESANGTIERAPFTVCWSAAPPDDPEEEREAGYCADGMPDDPPPPTIVPVDGTVRFGFDVPGWEFDARFLVSGAALPVEQIDATSWQLSVPAEVPDETVVVSGIGPQGDVHVSIVLPATTDGAALGGDAIPVEVRDHCAIGIAVVIGDERFLLDGELAGVAPGSGFPWDRSDFPADWDVEVMNAQPVDGDGFAIRGLEAIRVDDITLEVRDIDTRDPVGTFVLDMTPEQELVFCG